MSILLNACLALFMIFSGYSWADTITGEITFLKRPPLSGVLYVVGSHSDTVQGSLDQKDKAFTSDVTVVTPGGDIGFKNSDAVDHNIFANDFDSNVKFDIGLMPPASESSVVAQWDAGALIRVGCKIHPKMRSYVAVIDSNHYQAFEFRRNTTPSQHEVKIESIPADKEKVQLILPKYDPIEVTLKKNETVTVSLVKKGKEKGQMTLKRH